MPVAANTSLARLDAVTRNGLIEAGRERSLAVRYVERLRIKTPSIYTAAGALSGGNQQKVALARWLAIDPEVMILDEPTQGVDIGSKSEIHQIMGDLAELGMAIVMISSELPEILGMSDRIAVMHAGTIRACSRARRRRRKSAGPGTGDSLMLQRHRREVSLVVAIWRSARCWRWPRRAFSRWPTSATWSWPICRY